MLNFPSTPSLGQKYPQPAVVGVPIYTWDGEKWTTVSGPAGSGAAPETALPLIDGVANAGVAFTYSRGDHKHPTDTTRIPEAPVTGIMYGRMNASWQQVSTSATGTSNTPAGNVAATTVQGAINELDSEKVAKTGDSMSGTLNIAASNYLRGRGGAYGVIHRNDDSNYYMLFTAANDPDGTWSGLRPFMANLASGNVTMGHAVTMNAGLRVDAGISVGANINVGTTLYVGGGLTVASGGIYCGGWGGNWNSGVVFLNTSNDRYLHWDGTRYNLISAAARCASPYVGADIATAEWVWSQGYQGNIGFAPVQSLRLAYLTDWYPSNFGQLYESWGGGVITGAGTGSDPVTGNANQRYRSRQLQALINGGWGAVAYA
jgi:hypothetical protein